MTGQPTTGRLIVTGNFRNLDGFRPTFGIAVSGGGMSAYVRLTGSDTDFTGTWTGTIANGTAPTGVGGYKQPFSFSGTAAGTWSRNWTSSGTLTGTASGVVPSVLTQDPVVTQAVQVGAISSMSASSGPPYYDFISMKPDKILGAGTGRSHMPLLRKLMAAGLRQARRLFITCLAGHLLPLRLSLSIRRAAGRWTAYVNNGNVPAGGMGSAPNNQTAVRFNGKAAGTYTTVNGYNSIVGTASGKVSP